jgi:chromosome segregation ATPase
MHKTKAAILSLLLSFSSATAQNPAHQGAAIILLLLTLLVSAAAQQPDPCAKVTLRAETAEARLKTEREKTDERSDVLSRSLTKLASQVSNAEGELTAEREKSRLTLVSAASLAGALDTAQRRIADLESKLAERDKAMVIRAETIRLLIVENKRVRGWRASLWRVFGGR